MNVKATPSLRVNAELAKLGADITIARKRRRFTQQRLADGAGVNIATIRRLERGDAGVSLGVLAMVLLTLGESGRLGDLLDVAKDGIGLVLAVNELPKRVRARGRSKASPRLPGASKDSRGEPEAF